MFQPKPWNIQQETSSSSDNQPPITITHGMITFDSYHSILKKMFQNPNFLILSLPGDNFRIKFVIEKQNSIMSSNVYRLSSKHNNRSFLYCSKQIFGRYVFYIKNQFDQIIQKGYMSKYQDQYKLYLKQNNDKIEVAFFTSSAQTQKSKNSKQNKFKILLPINQGSSSQLQGIKSNIKKQSEIKWRWMSRSQKIEVLNIDKIKGNLLKLMYIYVSKGDTINDTKMVMRETGNSKWQYFIQNPLNIIQGFALSVLMAENQYN